MQLYPCVVFPSKKPFSHEVLSNLVEKTKQTNLLPNLVNCNFTIASFDLWMSKGMHDVFALVVKLLGKDYMPKYITTSLFEVSKISSQAFVRNL
jgi:hypothetical protein